MVPEENVHNQQNTEMMEKQVSGSVDWAKAEFQRRIIDVWLTNEQLKAPSTDKNIEFYGSYSDFIQRKEASFAEIFNKPSTDTISHLKR